MSNIDISEVIQVIKDLNYRLAKDGITKQSNDLAIKALEKQVPKKTKQDYTCPNCDTYNETMEKRMNTVKHDTVYCWHCGQAIEF